MASAKILFPAQARGIIPFLKGFIPFVAADALFFFFFLC